MHLEDAASAVVAAFGASGGTYNITDDPVTWGEAVSSWRRRFAAEGARVFITGRRKAKLDAAIPLAKDEVRGADIPVQNP